MGKRCRIFQEIVSKNGFKGMKNIFFIVCRGSRSEPLRVI